MKDTYNQNRNRKYSENKEYREKRIASSKKYHADNKENINAKRRVSIKKKPGKKPLTEKVCPKCNVLKSRSEYYKKLETISHLCKICAKKDIANRQHKYYGRYHDTQNKWRRDNYENNPEYRARVQAQKKAKYDRNKDQLNAKRRERYAAEPDCPDRVYSRSAHVREHTPPWVIWREINKIYADRPTGHHVDHMIPLRGKIDKRPVSGLHVPWNLQYLSEKDNHKKHCWVTEEYVNSL